MLYRERSRHGAQPWGEFEVRTKDVITVEVPGRGSALVLRRGGFVTADALSDAARSRALQHAAQKRRLKSVAERVAQSNARLTRQRVAQVRSSSEKFLDADAKLAARIERESIRARDEIRELSRRQLAAAQHGEQRRFWQGATVLSSLPLFAVFGRHNAQHNITLLILLLIWSFGEEATELLSGSKDPDAESRAAWWWAITPAANLLAGWWLLHEQQHEPLVSGIATEFRRQPVVAGSARQSLVQTTATPRLTSGAGTKAEVTTAQTAIETGFRPTRRYAQTYVCRVDLGAYVAAGFRLDLLAAGSLPALATVGPLSWSQGASAPRVESLSAQVELGELKLTLVVSAARKRKDRLPRDLLESANVGWVVEVLDTRLLDF